MAAPIILHYESAHPKQTKQSVIFSQMLRAERLGSNIECKTRGVNKIASLFTNNEYPHKLIQAPVPLELATSYDHLRPVVAKRFSRVFQRSYDRLSIYVTGLQES